jgi:hypothetical protein
MPFASGPMHLGRDLSFLVNSVDIQAQATEAHGKDEYINKWLDDASRFNNMTQEDLDKAHEDHILGREATFKAQADLHNSTELVIPGTWKGEDIEALLLDAIKKSAPPTAPKDKMSAPPTAPKDLSDWVLEPLTWTKPVVSLSSTSSNGPTSKQRAPNMLLASTAIYVEWHGGAPYANVIKSLSTKLKSALETYDGTKGAKQQLKVCVTSPHIYHFDTSDDEALVGILQDQIKEVSTATEKLNADNATIIYASSDDAPAYEHLQSSTDDEMPELVASSSDEETTHHAVFGSDSDDPNSDN